MLQSGLKLWTFAVCFLCWPFADIAHCQVFFSRAYDNPKEAKGDSRRLRKVLVPSASQREYAYVEDKVALRIELKEIQSVTIREAHFNDDVATALRRTPEARKKQDGPKGKEVAWYMVQIDLNESAARRMRKFSLDEEGKIVEIRIKSRRIAVARILEPMRENGFTITPYSSPDELRQVFAPLRSKLWWEGF